MPHPSEIIRREATEFPGNVEVTQQSRLDVRSAELLRGKIQLLRLVDHRFGREPASASIVQPVNAFQNAPIRGTLAVERGQLRRIDERRDGGNGHISGQGPARKNKAKRQTQNNG